MDKQTTTTKTKLEKAGMAASLLCAVHCMATPVLLFATPALGSVFADNPALEWLLLGTSIVSAAWVLGNDYRKSHGNLWPIIIAILGISLLFSGHDHSGEPLHSVAMASGGILMAVAFWRNYVLRRNCQSCAVH